MKNNNNQKTKKENSFLKFFRVLSLTVKTLPQKVKRNSTVVCAVLILIGIVLSAAAMPKSSSASSSDSQPVTDAVATAATTKPVGHKINGIPLVVQDYYKAGCETYACTMLLQGLGYDIDEHRFIDNYLITRDFSYDEAGNFCGPDMNSAFAGDLFTGAGIFCPGMAKSMNQFLSKQKNDSRRAYPIKGKTLEQLCKEYIDNDIPVMTWVTTYMQESYDKLSWVINYVDENAEHQIGDTMTWRQNEHCMVLIGYTDKEYIFNDSVAGEVVYHDKALAETRFEEIGNQAVVVK